MTVITLTAGTAFIMWLGEQITERGIGNGISLIIFAGIVARAPAAVGATLELLRSGTMNIFLVLILLVFMALVVAFIIFVEQGQRRIPVQYAKRVVGRRLDVEPGIFEYQLRLTAPSGRILYVSLVSLLPGTLSADWQGNRMRIHTLDLRVDAAAERERLERLVASCLGESLPDRPR